LSTIKQFKLLIKDIDFEPELIQDIIKQTGKDVGVKGKNLYMPCRIATTGNMHGPELPKMLSLLGKQTIMDRINYTISLLEEQK
jgi:glutamyl/glutaminyl-tRNA synthetase